MAKTLELKVLLNAVDRSASAFSNIRKRSERAKNSVSSLKKSFTSLTSLPTIIAGGVGLGAIRSFFNFGAALEQSKVGFEVMLGSAEKANKMINQINNLANTTPYANNDLIKVSETMLGFGISHQKVLPYMSMLGDIARGNKDRLSSLGLAFAQIQSAGKLSGQDLMQMINAGYNPLKDIAEKTGKSIGQIKDEMSKGAISAQMVAEAMIRATSQGGAFYNMSQKMSKTGAGQLSTVLGTLQSNLAEVSLSAMPIFVGLINDIGKALLSLSNFFKNNTDMINKLIIGIKWATISFITFKGAMIVRSVFLGFNNLIVSVSKFNKLLVVMNRVNAVGSLQKMARFTTLYGSCAKWVAGMIWLKNKAILFGNKFMLLSTNVIGKVVKFLRLQALWNGILTAKQWLLNIAMNANPIGLIISAVAALGTAVYFVIKKYDEWGAAFSLLLGPFGIIINMVMKFKENWEGIKNAFKTGGIKAGLLAIGKTLMDAVLYPIQQLLEIMENIPLIGEYAGKGAASVKEFRKNFEVPKGVNSSNKQTTVVNNSPTINVSSELTEKSKEDIKNILDEHAQTITDNVNEQNRINDRLNYVQ